MGYDYFSPGAEQWRKYFVDEMRRRAEERALVDVSALDPEQKRRLWAWIKANRPDLANILTAPAVGEIRELFSAKLMLPNDIVRDALDERS